MDSRNTPAWAWELNGAGDPAAVWIDHEETTRRGKGPKVDAGFKSGTWVMRLTLPNDLSEIEEDMDAAFVLMGLSDAGRRLDAKMADAVRLCRERGRSWQLIGDALGVTRQAAHQRFGGHEVV